MEQVVSLDLKHFKKSAVLHKACFVQLKMYDVCIKATFGTHNSSVQYYLRADVLQHQQSIYSTLCICTIGISINTLFYTELCFNLLSNYVVLGRSCANFQNFSSSQTNILDICHFGLNS